MNCCAGASHSNRWRKRSRIQVSAGTGRVTLLPWPRCAGGGGPERPGLVAKKKGDLEQQLAQQIADAGLPEPERHCRTFIPDRRLEADFLWRFPYQAGEPWPHGLVVEVQGGLWMQTKTGRGKGHAHPKRIEDDCEKAILAQRAGWLFFPVTGKQIAKGLAICWIADALFEYGLIGEERGELA